MGGKRDHVEKDHQLLCSSACSSSDARDGRQIGASQEALSSQESLGSTEDQFCLLRILLQGGLVAQLQGVWSSDSFHLSAPSENTSTSESCLVQGHAFP